jgi:molybdopterin-guanine dinucleotide biosynthesis protein A
MGSPKPALAWHGSTLLRRVTGIVARSVDGPVIVVRAPGQPLPPLDRSVEIVADAREGRGPLEGLAAGLAAVGDRGPVAFVSAADVPLLHPAFVRRVVDAMSDEFDVVLPDIGGHRQPLAAAYRVALLGTVERLLAADRLRPADLFERCRVLRLQDEEMLQNAALARLDPELRSVRNLNDPGDYARAHALPGPEIRVERFEPVAGASGAEPRVAAARAWSLGEAASSIGVSLDDVATALNGGEVASDPELPLVSGDSVVLTGARKH